MTDDEIKAIAQNMMGGGLFKALDYMALRRDNQAAGLLGGFPRLGDILSDANAREPAAPAAKPALPARALSGRRCIVGLRLP
jgi:hypothetical protein